ncbi:unnamed protein product, partial [Ectocarpus sp. 4 AP-2014]
TLNNARLYYQCVNTTAAHTTATSIDTSSTHSFLQHVQHHQQIIPHLPLVQTCRHFGNTRRLMYSTTYIQIRSQQPLSRTAAWSDVKAFFAFPTQNTATPWENRD